MRVTVTGATGLIGPRVVVALRKRGDEVMVLSRDPDRARARLELSTRAPGAPVEGSGTLQATHWDPLGEPAPSGALDGADAVVHLAGENVAQRWSESAKLAIHDSPVQGL